VTSRERIISAIQHRESDRLPIDFGSMGASGIQAVAYNKLKAYLGITTGQTRVFDIMLQLAEPEEWILNRFGADAINAGQGFAPDQWKDETLSDGSSCQIPDWVDIQKQGNERVIRNEEGTIVARMVQGGQGFSQTCWPLAHNDWTMHLEDLPEQASSICWRVLPEPIFRGGVSDANLERIENHLNNLRRSSDRAIVGPIGTSLFAAAGGFRGIDNLLMDLVTEQAKVEALLDKIVELHITRLGRLLPAFSNNVDLVWIGDDLGMETGPFFSPKLFREILKPRYKIIVDYIKSTNPNLKVFLHCCGSIYQLLGDLIEIGFDVINPVQISAKDMKPAKLKREFGSVITFWGGGCDTQHVLPRATPQQVKDHVRRNIDIFAPGGGFVFNQVHNILAEVPPENVVAMYEAAREYSESK